jgi:hypothetical protein
MKALIELENSQKIVELYLSDMPESFYSENIPTSWMTKMLWGNEEAFVPAPLHQLVDLTHTIASEELVAILGDKNGFMDSTTVFYYVESFDTFIASVRFKDYPMLRALAEFSEKMRVMEKTMKAVTEEQSLVNCYMALKGFTPYHPMPELQGMLYDDKGPQYSKKIVSPRNYLLRSFHLIHSVFDKEVAEKIDVGLTRYAEVSNQSHEEVEKEANALFEPILTLLETTKQVLSTR